MEASKIIYQRRIQRILFILKIGFFLVFFINSLFFFLFLCLPSVLIKLGIVSVGFIFLTLLLSFFLPLAILAYKYPVLGNKFLNSIIDRPYSFKDLNSIMELESGKSFPGEESVSDKKFSSFLTGEFIKKITGHILKEKRVLLYLFPNKLRIVAFPIFVTILVILSFGRRGLIVDVYRALASGLPVELISLKTPLVFEKLDALVLPPAYLESNRSKNIDLKVKNKIRTLEGSRIIIKGKIPNSPSGNLLLATDKGIEHFPVNFDKTEKAQPGKSLSKNFSISFLAPTKGAFVLEFLIKGQEPKKELRKSRIFIIQATRDKAPEIIINSPPVNHKIIFGNPLAINFLARDDYGILEINLYHRNPQEEGEFRSELIARFPRKPKREFLSTHIWNPVLQEGKKINELIYLPDTKVVEYYIEVKDTNIFSKEGITKSSMRYIYFQDKLESFKKGEKLLKELLKGGKDLLSHTDDKKGVDKYKNELREFVKKFNKEFKNILPRGNLINETNKMISALRSPNPELISNKLKNYLTFLKQYLKVLEGIRKFQKFKDLQRDISKVKEDLHKGNTQRGLKRLKKIFKQLGKNLNDELDQIHKLFEKGRSKEAMMRLQKLLEKAGSVMKNRMKSDSMMDMKLLKKLTKELDKLREAAKKQIGSEEKNIKAAKKEQLKKAKKEQSKINIALMELLKNTKGLSSEFPFIMKGLSRHAYYASRAGSMALNFLEERKDPRRNKKIPPDYEKSIKQQNNVITHLKAFLKLLAKQKQMLDQMSRGNFGMIMPNNFLWKFIFIPKEAIYTIPIDYRKKIIELSKDRKKSNKNKEAFWKELLE